MTAHAQVAQRGRGLRGLVVAAVAVVLVLGARAQTAGAASPTLTASENPVLIAAPATTKQIALKYDLGGSLDVAMLTVEEVGGPMLISTPVLPPSGSQPLTVTYGKSYQAQLVNLFDKSVVATLLITTARPDAPNPGGDSPCRGLDHLGWKVVPHGTYAEVPVTIYAPAMFTVTASTEKPDAMGNLAHIDSSAITFFPTTSWTGMLANLEPDTTYYVVVTAKDASGPKCGSYAMEQGSFKTLTRRVDVTFEKVLVTDNSDFSASCECTFFFKAGNEPTKSFGEVGVFDGGEVYPNAKVTVNNAPDTVTLRVSGFDDDENCGGILPPCSCGLPSDVVSDSGSGKCFDWSSASTSLDVAVAGPGEAFDGTFKIIANAGPLDYTVFGSFKVSFV